MLEHWELKMAQMAHTCECVKMASVPLKASDMGLFESNTHCPSAASIPHYKKLS